MTVQSAFTYTCDAIKCGQVSPIMENNWTLPPGWAQLIVKDDPKRLIESRSLHFCAKCGGAILDGFLKLNEEE